MSVVESGKVDTIGRDRMSGEIVLTISDHLEWDDPEQHLLILQSKINTYIAFIENEEIYQVYPESIGRKLRIDIVSQYEYPDEGIAFLDKVRPVLASIGVLLSNKVLD